MALAVRPPPMYSLAAPRQKDVEDRTKGEKFMVRNKCSEITYQFLPQAKETQCGDNYIYCQVKMICHTFSLPLCWCFHRLLRNTSCIMFSPKAAGRFLLQHMDHLPQFLLPSQCSQSCFSNLFFFLTAPLCHLVILPVLKRFPPCHSHLVCGAQLCPVAGGWNRLEPAGTSWGSPGHGSAVPCGRRLDMVGSSWIQLIWLE